MRVFRGGDRPPATDGTGRVALPADWQKAIDFLKIPQSRNRMYILTHGNAASPGNLQGLNAAVVARMLIPFRGFVKQITLVVCHGGASACGGVNFAEQLANLLIGFDAVVSAYTVPVGIWTEQLREKSGKPERLGAKLAKVGDENRWVRNYSGGVENRLDVKVNFPTRPA